jgi:hypothetical protein
MRVRNEDPKEKQKREAVIRGRITGRNMIDLCVFNL